MVSLHNVTKRFADKDVLLDFSWSLPEGQTTCLIGPSGCGKTTLLRIAAGLLAPDSGTVTSPHARSAYVFQEDRLLPWSDALENLTLLGIDEETARLALSRVLLAGDAHTLPDDLSGGMRRRLAIARALAYGGAYYFLDEPLRGLDPATAAPVLDAMRDALHGNTALLITHSPDEAFALSQRLVVVEGPPVRILRETSTDTFQDAEALKKWLQTTQSP